MTDYKYATEWLGYVSKSPPEEHGGFDPATIEGARDTLREIRRLKRENAMMRRWLKIIFDVPTGDEMFSVRAEIRAKLPDLFKTKKWGSK